VGFALVGVLGDDFCPFLIMAAMQHLAIQNRYTGLRRCVESFMERRKDDVPIYMRLRRAIKSDGEPRKERGYETRKDSYLHQQGILPWHLCGKCGRKG